MADSLLRIYHKLPPPLRSVAATLRGYKLRWWRYGAASEGLVAEALEREHWAPERLRAWQAERLAYVLHRAATKVPYYRAHWSERRRRGDQASWEQLENWPLLHKEQLRASPRAFVADDKSYRQLFAVNTSGTTGKPLRLWRSRRANVEYYALLEARFRRWHGVSWRDGWAILGGQVVVPPNAQGPPFWVRNVAMHQIYLSANHVSRRNAEYYVSALSHYGVDHLVAYPSSAAELARQCLAAGSLYRGLRLVITNAEPLLPSQREVIREAFGAPTRETYGMVEIVAGASECPSGTFHLWPELGHIEVLADHTDVPVPPGEAGRLVCTGLVNADMPLIRYDVGDRGSLPPNSVSCPCGRMLPRMGRIEGRANDMLIAADGRRVYWLNPIFYGLPVREAQIIQERLDLIRVRFVPAEGFTNASTRVVIERLQTRMGDVAVIMEAVGEIPRGPNGKFKSVISHLSQSR